MKLVLVVAVLLVFGGVALAAAPAASACTPYSVCAVQHDLRCAESETDPAEKVECVDLM